MPHPCLIQQNIKLQNIKFIMKRERLLAFLLSYLSLTYFKTIEKQIFVFSISITRYPSCLQLIKKLNVPNCKMFSTTSVSSGDKYCFGDL